MGLSIWQILLVVLLLVLLFGRGKISELMGDMARGIRSFKSGLEGNDETPPKTIEHEKTEPVARKDSSQEEVSKQ